jgi:hypothetical protein
LIVDTDENEPKAGAANKSGFTEPQVLAVLKQGESGVPAPAADFIGTEACIAYKATG